MAERLSLGDYVEKMRGSGRRWLEDNAPGLMYVMGPEGWNDAKGALHRYAGPHLGAAASDAMDAGMWAAENMTPAADVRDMMEGSGQIMSGDVLEGAGLMGGGLLAMAVPGSVGGAKKLTEKGIRAYHGSPHDFDKFDMSKIGTGEGAQAYGHGLYFAENENVARDYRQRLAQVSAEEFDKIGVPPSEWNAAKMFASTTHGESPEAAARDFAHWTGQPETPELVEAFRKTMKNRGRMYEVNINADPDDFLDWDKPLSEQPDLARRFGLRIRSEEEINDEAYALFEKYGAYDAMPTNAKARLDELNAELSLPGTTQTGREVYEFGIGEQENAHAYLTGPSANRTEEMLAAGIPGIKYLDQGSRAAGEGSRNYVVFDDKIIDILKKYGLAGLAYLPAGGLTGLAAYDRANPPIYEREQ